MNSVERAKRKIRLVIAGSHVPEDPGHADNTLEWLLRLKPDTDDALQLAALAHDIDRAIEDRKMLRSDYADYDVFKAAHADNSAKILKEILEECGVEKSISEEACRLVRLHETGGDYRSDLLKNADSISFFDVNLPLYFRREGREETIRRCIWGYQRLSEQMKIIVGAIISEDEELTTILKDVIANNYKSPLD